MSKYYNVGYPLAGDCRGVIQIRTKSKYLWDLLCGKYAMLFGRKALSGNNAIRRDFFIDFNFISDYQGLAKKNKSKSLDFSCQFDKKSIIYNLVTPRGSSLEINYFKRYAQVGLIEKDPMITYFVDRMILFTYSLARMFMVHGAWVKRGKSSFFLIGRSGVGKTTISSLLTNQSKDYKLMDDDSPFIFQADDTLFAASRDQRLVEYSPNYLFFISKKPRLKSEACPLSSKESFKRLIEHSDVIFRKNDPMTDYRLDVLRKLAMRCKSYLLINGKDLIGSKVLASTLFNGIIKRRKNA
ncbi:MAG: hypothetical protein K9L86_00380 [Candidatus Omnitrophica bacterium]|nr:hypothetical protein [Candidatus Omnitrophota bacterium]